MVRYAVTVVVTAVLCFGAGCEPGGRLPGGKKEVSPLAGEWRATDKTWVLTFDDSGKLESFRHPWEFSIRVAEGSTTALNAAGQENDFFLGEHDVTYDKNSGAVAVKLELAYFHMIVDNQVLEGACMDYFDGNLAPGADSFDVVWRNYMKVGNYPDMAKEDLPVHRMTMVRSAQGQPQP